MSYHQRERIGSQDLLYPQRNAQEDQKGIFEVCRDGKEHADSHIEKAIFSNHKEMAYHRGESLSSRERTGCEDSGREGRSLTCDFLTYTMGEYTQR